MAGDDVVHGNIMSGSSGFHMANIVEWRHAKYGKLDVIDYANLHVLQVGHGKMCAAVVTLGKANDSPYLRKMIEMLPKGFGYVMADAMYGGKKNCRTIADSGRKPIIEPKAGYKIKGHNARAEMLRFYEEHPGTFYKILRKRNNVESLFSSVKSRFKAMVRALQEHTQTVELLSKCICYYMSI